MTPTNTEKNILKDAFKKWEKEIGADFWSVWDNIETEQLELLLLRGYQLAQKETAEKVEKFNHEIDYETKDTRDEEVSDETKSVLKVLKFKFNEIFKEKTE